MNMKYKRAKKSYEIDRSKIDEGYLYGEMSCYAPNANKAKVLLLEEHKWEIQINCSSVSYIDMPVKRNPENDLYEFEGSEKTLKQIEYIQTERKRISKLESILDNPKIKYCYIKKGNYYRPNSCGYTDFKHRAGIYTKEEAVSHAKSCDRISLEPIDVDKHNKMINDEINDLKRRLI